VVQTQFGTNECATLLQTFVSFVQEGMGKNIISIVLYGSVARGEASTESDIDLLLVVQNASPSYYERLRPMLPLLRQLRQHPSWQELQTLGWSPEVNVLILSKQEADQNRLLYLDMTEKVHILVDQAGFFQGRLQKLQARLRSLQAQKIRQNGNWYWDLKPDWQPQESVVL